MTATKTPALVASSISRRLAKAGVEAFRVTALDRSFPTIEGEVVEVVGRVSVNLTTFDLVEGRIVERDMTPIVAAAREALAGFVVVATRGGAELEVTLAERAELLEAKVETARGHAFAARRCIDTDRCAVCGEVDGHGIHDAGRRAELAEAARAALTAQTAVELEVVEVGEAELPAGELGQLDLFPIAPRQLELDLAGAAPATLAVVQCSGAKLDQPAPAGELYTGTLHRLEAAAAAATGHRVVILSALHGLLDLDQVVAPYEQRIDTAGAIAVAELADQLVALGRPRLVALTSKAYTAALTAAAELAGCEVETPLAGSRSIFELRSRLCAIRDGRRPLAA